MLCQHISHGTSRHRHIGVVVVQQVQGRPAPVGQRVLQARNQRTCAKHATVEQQSVGQGWTLLAQKIGQVAGNSRVPGIRQAKFDQATPGLRRLRAGRHLGKKTVHDQLRHVLACERDRAAAANQARAAAHQGHLHLLRGICSQQLFFGLAAALHQLGQLAGRQAGRGRSGCRGRAVQAGLHQVRQRQVHVVAAQHQVLAHAGAGDVRLAPLPRHVDQAQVGGATAHVAHQHPLRLGQRCFQRAAVAPEPVIKHRLGLFQQTQLGQPGQARRAQRQRAGGFVKRGGHGQDQVLLVQRRLGVLGVPGIAHMAQVTGTGLHGRDLKHLGGRAPRQDGRQSVHGRVRQPAFGTGDQPTRHLRAQVPRPLPDDDRRGISRLGRPGQLQRRAVELIDPGVVTHRGQQRQCRDLASGHELLDLQHLDTGLFSSLAP